MGTPVEPSEMLSETSRKSMENTLNLIKASRDGYDETNRKFAIEFSMQKDNALNNMLMDYFVNDNHINEGGSGKNRGVNVSKIYNKMNNEKDMNRRKINISQYYIDLYREYIDISKIILLNIFIIFIISFINKKNIISGEISKFLIIIVILFTIGITFNKLYGIYNKDRFKFEKDNQNFDSTNAKNVRELGSPYSKPSLLDRFGIVCIGEECCTDEMVYDNERNRCIKSHSINVRNDANTGSTN